MSKKTPIIRILAENQAADALEFLSRSGRAYDADDTARLAQGLESGDWTFVMVAVGGEDVGCFYLNWTPKYHVFRALKLPELQDLRVLPGFRRQGIARALVAFGENYAREKGAQGVGLAVGLTADYGAAQCLYADMGYKPDGNGISFDREPVEKGDKIALNDDACLMLLKLF